MALRDKLRERVQPFLEPGEEVQAVFPAQTGPTPWLAGAFGALIYVFFAKYRIVVVTDRSIVLLRSGAFTGASPKELVARLPRDQQLGPVKGMWGKIQLDGTRHWVHKRFHGDIAQADAALTGES
jgi:hypothetical protein